MAVQAGQRSQATKSPGILGQVQKYRWTELVLFILPFLMLLLEMSQLLIENTDKQLALSRSTLPTLQGLLPILGLIAALFVVHLILNIFFRKSDQMLLPLVGLLSGLGVLMATRLGPDVVSAYIHGVAYHDPTLGTRQLVWVLLGLGVFLATMFLLRDLDMLKRFQYTIAFLGILLVCVTLVNTLRYGFHNLNAPSRDQLNICPFAFQPSEFLKIFIVTFFAGYLSDHREVITQTNLRFGPFRLPPLKHLGPPALMLVIALLLFLVVRELGLALLIYGIFLSMLYLGSGKLSYAGTGLLIFLLLGFVGYLLFGYVRARFVTVTTDVVHWNAASQALYDAPGGSQQVVQGLIALSSGGIFGAGLGLGHPAGLYFVPVVQSDMVLTAFGEELGLVGLFAIIAIYLLIIYRGFRIAIDAPDTFSQLLAAGLTSIFAIQTLIIIAGNMKFFPLTGIPLPFLSYGGSSMIANYIIVGILLRISYNSAVARESLEA
jgi:cell division protein FtsW (lipid II flippase)